MPAELIAVTIEASGAIRAAPDWAFLHWRLRLIFRNSRLMSGSSLRENLMELIPAAPIKTAQPMPILTAILHKRIRWPAIR
jgi:hypothetical protein